MEIDKIKSTTFALFVFLQIFNSFNCKELGMDSVFKNFFSNKLMVISMTAVLTLQIVLTEFTGFLSKYPLGAVVWLKIIGLSFCVILVSETYKLLFRLLKKNIHNLHKKRLNEKAGV